MPISLLDLPTELQLKIFDNLYEPWHLQLKHIPTYTGFELYTFTPSVHLQKAPLLVNRSIHALSSSLLDKSFEGILDIGSHNDDYSITPKYKRFVQQVTKLRVYRLLDFRRSMPAFEMRLPALRLIEAQEIPRFNVNRQFGQLDPDNIDMDTHVEFEKAAMMRFLETWLLPLSRVVEWFERNTPHEDIEVTFRMCFDYAAFGAKRTVNASWDGQQINVLERKS